MTPADDDLLDHIVAHLCDEHAEAVAELPDAEIRRRAALGIARAGTHGIVEPEPVTAFVTLMFLVAPDFDRQPGIAAALAAAKGPSAQRMRNLFANTAEKDWDDAAARTRGWEGIE